MDDKVRELVNLEKFLLALRQELSTAASGTNRTQEILSLVFSRVDVIKESHAFVRGLLYKL